MSTVDFDNASTVAPAQVDALIEYLAEGACRAVREHEVVYVGIYTLVPDTSVLELRANDGVAPWTANLIWPGDDELDGREVLVYRTRP